MRAEMILVTAPRRVYREPPPCNAAAKPETLFAVVSPIVTLHPSLRIAERRQDIGKAEPAFTLAAIVFRIIPLEPDLGSVRQWANLPDAGIVASAAIAPA